MMRRLGTATISRFQLCDNPSSFFVSRLSDFIRLQMEHHRSPSGVQVLLLNASLTVKYRGTFVPLAASSAEECVTDRLNLTPAKPFATACKCMFSVGFGC